MPLYEYLCGSCGHRFERIQKFSDPPVTECPSCGGVVEKQFSSPAIQFKGSGWYITDYAKSGSSGKPASSGGAESPDSSSKDKPDATAKAKPEAASTPAADTAKPASPADTKK